MSYKVTYTEITLEDTPKSEQKTKGGFRRHEDAAAWFKQLKVKHKGLVRNLKIEKEAATQIDFKEGDKVRIVKYENWRTTLFGLSRSPVGRTGTIEEVTPKGVWINLDDGPIVFVESSAELKRVKEAAMNNEQVARELVKLAEKLISVAKE